MSYQTGIAHTFLCSTSCKRRRLNRSLSLARPQPVHPSPTQAAQAPRLTAGPSVATTLVPHPARSSWVAAGRTTSSISTSRKTWALALPYCLRCREKAERAEAHGVAVGLCGGRRSEAGNSPERHGGKLLPLLSCRLPTPADGSSEALLCPCGALGLPSWCSTRCLKRMVHVQYAKRSRRTCCAKPSSCRRHEK